MAIPRELRQVAPGRRGEVPAHLNRDGVVATAVDEQGRDAEREPAGGRGCPEAVGHPSGRPADELLDHPATDDAHWGHVNSVVSRAADGAMTVSTAPLPALDDELGALLGPGGH